MYPQIELNYLAITAAVIANFILGALWYGPLFGKAWAKEVGIGDSNMPSKNDMMRAMILTVIGAFLTAYVISHSSAVWRPSVWNAGPDGEAWSYGFYTGFFVWIGYYVPQILNLVGFERRSWKFFAINGGYAFISLQIVAMIVSFWR